MDFSNLGQILNLLSSGPNQSNENISQNNSLSINQKDFSNKNIGILACYPNFNLDGSSNLTPNTFRNTNSSNLQSNNSSPKQSFLNQNLNLQNNFEPLLNILNTNTNNTNNDLQNPLQNILGNQNNILSLLSSLAPILSKNNANPLQNILQGFLNKNNNPKVQKNAKDESDSNKEQTIESFKNVNEVDFENNDNKI